MWRCLIWAFITKLYPCVETGTMCMAVIDPALALIVWLTWWLWSISYWYRYGYGDAWWAYPWCSWMGMQYCCVCHGSGCWNGIGIWYVGYIVLLMISLREATSVWSADIVESLLFSLRDVIGGSESWSVCLGVSWCVCHSDLWSWITSFIALAW